MLANNLFLYYKRQPMKSNETLQVLEIINFVRSSAAQARFDLAFEEATKLTDFLKEKEQLKLLEIFRQEQRLRAEKENNGWSSEILFKEQKKIFINLNQRINNIFPVQNILGNGHEKNLPAHKELIILLNEKGPEQVLSILCHDFNHLSNSFLDKIILLSADLHALIKENLDGKLTYDNFTTGRNKISKKVLKLINHLEDEAGTKAIEQNRISRNKNQKTTTGIEEALSRIEFALLNKSLSLDLSGLHLKEIPNELSLLANLESLFLNENNIKKIENLKRLVKLETLDLSFNQLKEIKNLETLVNLRTLKLAGNTIANFQHLEQLIALEYLYFEDNNFTKIEHLSQLVQLKMLSLSSCQIQVIENLDKLVNLEILLLDGNEIKVIENLEHLTKMKILHLESNSIKKINNLNQLDQLTHLDLSNNQIEEIENLETCTKLVELDLSSNKISKVENIGHLKDLEKLNLKSNKISKLCDFNTFPKLQNLSLRHNNINAIALSENQSLFTYLQSKDNDFIFQINDNPCFAEIAGLKDADYSDEKTANHYRVFLNDEKIIKQQTHLVEVVLPHKLVLLGNSNAGKSSLVEFLHNDTLQTNGGKESTIGLDIVPWKPKNKKKPEFLIYDFGGQDYYHATYQMFISEEATYLVLWSKDSNHNHCNNDGTKQRPEDYYCFDVNYWLGNIRYINETVNTIASKNNTKIEEKKSKQTWFKNLFLVENKIDVDFKDKAKPLKADKIFGDIEKFRISLLRKTDNSLLRKRRRWLKDYLQHLHHRVSRDIASRAKAIEDYLQDWENICDQKNEWNYQEIKKYLQEKFESWAQLEEDEVRRMLHRFSVSGLLIWYRYDDKLDNKIWVNPIKLQEQILTALNLESVKSFKGKIPVPEFRKIQEFKKLKDVLLKKHIVFLDEADQTYIIPQNLELQPNGNPLYQIAVQGLKTSFTVRFKNFMPLGIMNRLICMFGKLSDQKFYSRYEIIFSIKGEKVLLKCDMINLLIQVKITSDLKDIWKDVFTYILLAYNRIEELPLSQKTNSIENISPTSIPTSAVKTSRFTSDFNLSDLVPSDLQVSLGNQYFVNYSELQKAFTTGKKFIRTVNKDKKVKSRRAYRFNAFMNENFAQPKKVFISYSHDDIEYRRDLQKYLINLERENLIEIWQDGMIQPGTDWDRTIRENLEAADIVILLVSQNFIASNYIYEVELKTALRKLIKDKSPVLPILIKNCDFQNWKAVPENGDSQSEEEATSLSAFQFMPHNQEQRLMPLNQWKHPEEGWVQISHKLRNAIEKGG